MHQITGCSNHVDLCTNVRGKYPLSPQDQILPGGNHAASFAKRDRLHAALLVLRQSLLIFVQLLRVRIQGRHTVILHVAPHNVKKNRIEVDL